MFLQQRHEFLLECHLSMMFRLAFDVLNDGFHPRLAHAKRAILLLPRKLTVFGKCFMHPFGRAALNQLQSLGDGHRGWQRKQDVNMVFHAADFNGFHLVLARNAAQKRPESLGECRSDEGTTFFGAEDAMMVGTDVGHAAIQPSLRDLRNTELIPALKRRAIVVRPSGTIWMRLGLRRLNVTPASLSEA
jgi:hypothetical protein